MTASPVLVSLNGLNVSLLSRVLMCYQGMNKAAPMLEPPLILDLTSTYETPFMMTKLKDYRADINLVSMGTIGCASYVAALAKVQFDSGAPP
jgi:hypothetical protein